MTKDTWHYARTALAKQLIELFDTGLASALVFFAPRRMGKTEFLRKDIQPYAEKQGWKVFYFSFLDVGDKPKSIFTNALVDFVENSGAINNRNSVLSRINKVSGAVASVEAKVELREKKPAQYDIKKIITFLAKSHRVLLLLDEVQTLAKYAHNEKLIASLRTALDLHKDSVKVIFTGSSREGLRQMFSQASAPFFHFGQNLPFPKLGQEFTDHLAHVFHLVTKRNLDKDTLWSAFQDMECVPQLARSLVERLALYPDQTITQAKNQLLADIYNDRTFSETWESVSTLEKLLLQEIVKESRGLFSESTRKIFAKQLGIETLAVPSVQSALRTLQKKLLIGREPEQSGYFIDDPNFKNWLSDQLKN